MTIISYGSFIVDQMCQCDMLGRTNEQQHIRGDTQKVQRQGETRSHSHREGKKEKSHSRMKKKHQFELRFLRL